MLDTKRPGVIQLKVGRAVNLTKRLDQWGKQCGSKVPIVRGWWPGTVEDESDDDGTNGSLLTGNIKAGEPGPLCHRVERLVHIELADLVVHTPYLDPNFPKVDNSDTSPSTSGSPKKATMKPCLDCKRLSYLLYWQCRIFDAGSRWYYTQGNIRISTS